MANIDFIKDTHALQIVTDLSNMQIEEVEKEDLMVSRRLGILRDAIWGKVNIAHGIMNIKQEVKTQEDRDAKFAEAMSGLDKKQQELLISSYAKMGHLYEIATLSARSNYFKNIKDDPRERAVAFGGIEEFIYNEEKDPSVKNKTPLNEWIKKLNQPVFEMTFTAHPTNVNSLESMRAQREIAKALEAGDKVALKAAIAKYQTTPLLHNEGANLTVRDETENTLYFLGNIYEDLAKSYQQFDDTLSRKARFDDALARKEGKEGVQYDPTLLDLKTKFGAWGSSGDKDGNKNVTAETTLEAIALHTKAALEHYSKDLTIINSPALEHWKNTLSEKEKALEPLLEKIAELRIAAKETSRINNLVTSVEETIDNAKQTIENTTKKLKSETNEEKIKELNEKIKSAEKQLAKGEKDLPEAQKKFEEEKAFRASPERLSELFDTLSKELVDLRKGLNDKEFTADLKTAYDKNKDQATLNLLRRARTFGFTFGKIEYRETAEEYARVVEELISKQVPNYSKLSPEEKANTLTRLLNDPENVAAKSLKEMAQEIVQKGAGKAYSDDSAFPITYHSIKRMALARDFPDMIKDNVLAECGQLPENVKPDADGKNVAAQGVANLLEAQFLQRAVEQNGKRAKLGIVPLFEEPDTMAHIDKIMGAAYENAAYKKQIELIKDDRGTAGLVQQVQIAHSDNARRSGLQAARAYIHEAHKKMREVEKNSGIETEFFEGGSVSDAYRNGVRAISANVNSFGLHKFAKMTFQGGDLLNYFNHPDSTSRLFYRTMSHQASWMQQDEKGNWLVSEPVKSKASDRIKSEDEIDEERRGKDRTPNAVMDGVVIKSLKEMLHDYQENDFKQSRIGVLLGILDYDKEVANSNSSSRAANRTPVQKVVDAVSDAVGAVENVVKKAFNISPVKIDKVRTIGFSKAFQNNGIVPSWIGSKELRAELEKFTQEKHHELSHKSPAELTRDESEFEKLVKQSIAENKGVFTLSPQLLKQFYNKSNTFRDAQDRAVFALALSDMNAAEKIINGKLSSAANANEFEKDGRDYFARVKETYEAAASLAYEAVTGKAFSTPKSGNAHERNNEIEKQIIKALPNLNGEFERKKNYGDFIFWLRSEKPEIFDEPNLARMAICAGDTVNHGRWLGASDQTYINSRSRASQSMAA